MKNVNLQTGSGLFQIDSMAWIKAIRQILNIIRADTQEAVQTSSEVVFPPRKKQSIMAMVEDGVVKFDVTLSDNTTFHFRFDDEFFSQSELKHESEIFGFEVIPHEYSKNSVVGSFGSRHLDYEMKAYGVISILGLNTYLLVYANRGATTFEDNIVYVHGIWQVQVSNEFKRRLNLS